MSRLPDACWAAGDMAGTRKLCPLRRLCSRQVTTESLLARKTQLTIIEAPYDRLTGKCDRFHAKGS